MTPRYTAPFRKIDYSDPISSRTRPNMGPVILRIAIAMSLLSTVLGCTVALWFHVNNPLEDEKSFMLLELPERIMAPKVNITLPTSTKDADSGS